MPRNRNRGRGSERINSSGNNIRPVSAPPAEAAPVSCDAVSRGPGAAHGIMQEVLDRTSGKVRLWPATLYGTIKRLTDEKLIKESDRRPARAPLLQAHEP